MKKILTLILTTFLIVLGSISFINADSINNPNTEVIIYERFIDKKSYSNLSTTSIWKKSQEYTDALYKTLTSDTPLYTIDVN